MPRKQETKHKEAVETPDSSGQTRTTAKIDHVFAASGDAPVNNKSPWKAKVRYTLNKGRKSLAVALAAILVFSIGLAVIMESRREAPVVVEGCSDKILKEAKGSLHITRVEYLHPIVQKILRTPGYDKDPNCLYVALTYYINTSDPENAQSAYDKLSAVYNPDKGYSNVIADDTRSLKKLKSEVDFIKQQDKEIKDTGFFGNESDVEAQQ